MRACLSEVAPSSARGLLAAAAVAASLTIAPTALALTVIDNGQGPPNPSNVLDATDPSGEDYLVDSDPCTVFVPGSGCTVPPLRSTLVEVRPGASVGSIETVGNSGLNVLGGSVDLILVEDTTTLFLDVAGPGVGVVEAFDDASVRLEEALLAAVLLSGNSVLTHLGTVHGIVEVNDQATMLLAGEPVASGTDSGVLLSGSGSLRMVSGWITDNGLQAGGSSKAEVFGGIIDVLGVLLTEQAQLTWRGGEISALDLDGTSVATIAGGSFAIDGVPVGLGAVAPTSGLLTGTLANGDPLSVPFDREASAALVLIPEPSTSALLALGLLACAARARRFSGAAAG